LSFVCLSGHSLLLATCPCVCTRHHAHLGWGSTVSLYRACRLPRAYREIDCREGLCAFPVRRLSQQAEQQLLAVCRPFVASAAADAWQNQEVAGDGEGASAPPAACPWEAAIRAPLLVAILQTYRQVSPAAWRREMRCARQRGRRSAGGLLQRMRWPGKSWQLPGCLD
jgi:hypothetical protein